MGTREPLLPPPPPPPQAKATFLIMATVQVWLSPVCVYSKGRFEEKKKKGPGPDPHPYPAGLGEHRWQEGLKDKILMTLSEDGKVGLSTGTTAVGFCRHSGLKSKYT